MHSIYYKAVVTNQIEVANKITFGIQRFDLWLFIQDLSRFFSQYVACFHTVRSHMINDEV